jgi:glycosyltransferase involved in cell wall biosynthesis
MPLVSVIIPTFNRADVIERAVGSVLSQTFRDFELIVVDDGSTDQTDSILCRHIPHITTIHQTNKGVAAARNAGILHASGELLAFLDSDDAWLPVKLERQVERYGLGPGEFICHTDELWIRDGQPLNQKAIHRKQGGWFFERALERCLISPSTVLLARELFDRVGWFDESLPAAEDYDLWLRITAFYAVEFVAEPLVVKYGGAADQLSRSVPVIDRFRIKAILKILDHPDLRPEYRHAAIRELRRKCAIVASGYKKRGNDAEAELYRALADHYPLDESRSRLR